MKQVVCEAGQLGPGQIVSTQLGPMPVAVVRTLDGQLYGLLDKCLHQGGRLSQGVVQPAPTSEHPADYQVDDNTQILKCPWHGYEYDLKTGCTLFDPSEKVRIFSVREEDGQIVVET
ncbi:MAG: Rieske (2Fe-2S) protein [Solirubrobacterales bacterium]|nr:Rieske (2Fe-2S) protein [Solirubrobacterales bacterium]